MSVSEVDNARWREMFDAIYHGDCAHVREMLSQGVSANTKNNGNETALVYAASHGRDKCVEALLEYGAAYEELPIADAAVPRDPTVLRRFLRMGGEDADTLRNALSEAAFYGNADTVRILLAQGADPEKTVQGRSLFDAPDQWDCTPEERAEVLSLLREAVDQKAA